MALLITDECISCGACLPECPNEAIFETRSDAETKGNHVGDGQGVGDSIYVITHDRCTECVGHFDEPQCAAVCPVDNCCISDPLYPETTEVLLERARTLNPDKAIDQRIPLSGVEHVAGRNPNILGFAWLQYNLGLHHGRSPSIRRVGHLKTMVSSGIIRHLDQDRTTRPNFEIDDCDGWIPRL